MKRWLALALWSAAAAAWAVDSPVAVMSFKNLNADPSLEWMRVGVAETLVSDLKKRSSLRMVERDQVDKALSEVMLQGKQGGDESTAAKVGKLVGAKTIVLGAFQKAGTQLRITARFITVETGEVVDTAKTTGPVSDVFLLQDEIVARLMGEKWVKPSGAKAGNRRASPKRLKAYQFYAMALNTASDADRVGFLNQAIEADPEFSYALEELDALKKRMEGYRKNAVQVGDQEEVRLQQAFQAPDQTAQQRMINANALMVHYLTRQQHTQLKAMCKEVLSKPEYAELHEQFLFRLFESERSTAETDAAFRHGEEFLRRFPRSPFFSVVDSLVRDMIRNREDRPRNEAKYAERLKQIEEERARDAAEKDVKPEIAKRRQRGHDLERCTEASSMDLPERAIEECGAFAKKWAGDTSDATFAFQVPVALLNEAKGYSSLGKNAKAREIGNRIIKEYPELAREWRIEEIVTRAWAGE